MKKFGWLKILLSVFLGILIVFGGAILGIKLYLDSRVRAADANSEKVLKDTTLIDRDWDYTSETLPKSEYGKDYDGDGLKNGEEISLGTSFYTSDTDRDGLSDYVEVKTYSSNPLKVSTAGDDVSDLVKVIKKMNISEVYDGKNYVSNPVEVAPGVMFSPADINSEILHVYEVYSGNIFKDVQCLVDPFTIYNGEGKIAINLKNGYNKTNTLVYYYDTQKQIIVKDTKAKISALTVEFTAKNNFPVAVINKDTIPDSMLHSGSMTAEEEKLREFYLVWVPFSIYDMDSMPENEMFNTYAKPYINEEDTLFILESKDIGGISNFEGDPAIEQRIMKNSTGWLAEHYKINSFLLNVMLNIYNDYASRDDEKIQQVLQTVIIKRIECSLRNLGEQVDIFMTENGIEVKSTTAGSFDSDSGFNVSINGFTFSNLSTTVSPNGVCAGFSFLARQGYNGFVLKKEAGTYTFDKYSAPGYKAATPVFSSIFSGTPGKYEAKSKPLIAQGDEVYDDYDAGYLITASQLGDPDKTVVDLLNYYWLYNNAERIKFEQTSGILKHYDYNFSTIDDINNEFKNGRIVEMGIFGGIGGHAIVGHRLHQDYSDSNLFYLGVYDSNFPENKRFVYVNKKIVRAGTEVVMKIRRYPKIVMDNKGNPQTKYFFSFDYQVGNGSYRWTNMYGASDRIVFYKTGTTQHSVFVK